MTSGTSGGGEGFRPNPPTPPPPPPPSLLVHMMRSVPSSPPASPRTGLVIYKPLEDVTAYEGDTNVQFSMVVAAGDGPTFLNYIITSVPIGSVLQTTILPVQSGVVGSISGPVLVNDSGTVVTCQVFSSTGITSYTATLTVLGEL